MKNRKLLLLAVTVTSIALLQGCTPKMAGTDEAYSKQYDRQQEENHLKKIKKNQTSDRPMHIDEYRQTIVNEHK